MSPTRGWDNAARNRTARLVFSTPPDEAGLDAFAAGTQNSTRVRSGSESIRNRPPVISARCRIATRPRVWGANISVHASKKGIRTQLQKQGSAGATKVAPSFLLLPAQERWGNFRRAGR